MLTVIREMAEESEKKEHRRVPPTDLLPSRARRGRGRRRAHAGAARRAAERGRRRRRRRRARRDRARDGLRRDRRRAAGGAGRRGVARASTRSTSSSPSTATAPCSSSKGESLDSDALEAELEKIGDSLLVVGDATALKVHVHTDDPGQALTLGTAVGVVEGVEIANMHHQTAPARGAPARGQRRRPRSRRSRPASSPSVPDGATGACSRASAPRVSSRAVSR